MKHTKILIKSAISVLSATALMIVAGCTTPKISKPERTGLEQLLLSNAVDLAVDNMELPIIDGRDVFLEEAYLEAYDSKYLIGSVRAILSENGARLVDEKANADVIIEARSGALGIDSSESLLGIPSVPIIVPGAGTLTFPELVLYKSSKAQSVSKIALLAYDRSGANVFSSDAYVGKSHFNSYKMLLFLNLNFTDIPERADY